MIQLYKPTNTDYTKNGDMTLFPTSAEVSVELNGTWEASLSHPIDEDGRWQYIVDEAVVKMPSFNGEQLFRIKQKTKTDSGVTVTMEPIFMDAMEDCYLVDVRPTSKNGQQALDLMTAANSKYEGESNISKVSTAYYMDKNLIEAINSDDENSFVNRWGGEILFDNFKVIINEKIGSDHGVEVRYGKNLPINGIQEEVDFRDVKTRIYPKAYNGYKMTGNGYVDSPLVDSYPTIKVASITFDDVKMRADAVEDEADNVIICDNQSELDAALTERCEQQYELGLDKPKITLSIDMVLLHNTENYKEYENLETVSLGDTIHCIHNNLNIKTDARVIKLKYNSLLKTIDSVVLGDFSYNYFDNVSAGINRIDNVVRKDGSIIAEQIKGFIDGAIAQLRVQSTIAKKQETRAILFEDLDPESDMFGAMALGTQGLEISRQRTADGREWEWTTALTAEGLIANVIVAGVISDKFRKSFWNLNTGELEMSGVFKQYNDETGFISISIEDHEVFLFDYRNNGKHAGSVGTLHQGEQVGVGLWTRESGFVTLGVWDPEDKQINSIFSYDTMYPKRTPYITNTANGTIFQNNSGGGIVVENGLIKSWNLGTATGTLNLMGANGQEAIVMTIKDGLIQSWRVE